MERHARALYGESVIVRSLARAVARSAWCFTPPLFHKHRRSSFARLHTSAATNKQKPSISMPTKSKPNKEDAAAAAAKKGADKKGKKEAGDDKKKGAKSEKKGKK